MSNILGTGFAQSGFSFDPNLSPFNQSFAAAVRAVEAARGYPIQAPFVSVTSFGADPTNNQDSTAAINAADAAATKNGQTLYFPAGTYAINTGHRITRNGCSWAGAGMFASVLKSLAGTYAAATNMVTCNGLSNFTTQDMGFDMSLVTFPSATTCRHLLVFGCTNWSVSRCAFTGIQDYNLAIYPNGGDEWRINECYFNNAAPSTNQSQAINIQQVSGTHVVSKNVCIGAAIFSNGANGLFEGNTITGWKFGGGIVLGPNTACSSNRVIGNHCVGGLGDPDVNNTYSAGIECWSAYSQLIGNYCASNMGAGISVGGTSCIVSNNQCLNNGQSGQNFGGITAYTISGYSASQSIIVNNQLSDNQGSPTQNYGYAEFGGTGTITGVVVANNLATGNVTGSYLFKTGPRGTSFVSGPLQVQKAAGVNGATPPAQVTGWGTPVSNAVIANFSGAVGAESLTQVCEVVAQIITDLKAFGLYGA